MPEMKKLENVAASGYASASIVGWGGLPSRLIDGNVGPYWSRFVTKGKNLIGNWFKFVRGVRYHGNSSGIREKFAVHLTKISSISANLVTTLLMLTTTMSRSSWQDTRLEPSTM